jgi:hypothetical protein
MIYVEINPAYAEEYSRGIMRLLRPSHLRNDNWTDFYCQVLTHPVDGRKCLVLPESEYVPIHIEANGQELSQMLQLSVADGSITQMEADAIGAAVVQMAGQTVRIVDFIPPSWQQNIYTKEQLEADGWFTAEELI